MVERFARALALISALAVTNSAVARSQQTAADTAMVLYRAAVRAEAAGESRLAESLLRFVLNQYPGTAAAEQAGEKLRSLRPEHPASGRVELTVWGAIYGGWLGIAVPWAFGAEEASAYGTGLLVGSPTGLLAGRALARSGPMSLGQARAIRWGSIWGTWQGIGWREVLELGTRTEVLCFENQCFESETTAAGAPPIAAIVGGLSGIAVASALARTREIDVSTSTAVELGSLWGTWFGLWSGVALGAEEDTLIAVTLLSGNAALLASALAAPKLRWSVARYRLVSAAGLAGALAGLGVALLLEVPDEKVGASIVLAGSATGLGLGIAATGRETGPSGSEAVRQAPALLNFARGRAIIEFPAPLPGLLPAGQDGVKRRWVPGFYLKLAELSLPW